MTMAFEKTVNMIRRAYWVPYYRLTGTTPPEEEIPQR
jgi:hypothetical protein